MSFDWLESAHALRRSELLVRCQQKWPPDSTPYIMPDVHRPRARKRSSLTHSHCVDTGGGTRLSTLSSTRVDEGLNGSSHNLKPSYLRLSQWLSGDYRRRGEENIEKSNLQYFMGTTGSVEAGFFWQQHEFLSNKVTQGNLSEAWLARKGGLHTFCNEPASLG